jgi:hypothetical protein
MKTFICVFGIMLFLLSCSTHEKNLHKNIIYVTKKYLASQLKHPEIRTFNKGIINIKGEGKGFIIDSIGINIGNIDEDTTQDAIVSYLAGIEGKPLFRKHLILLNKGKLKVVRDFTSEMKVMWISNHLVYAQIPKLSSDAPTRDCNICVEDVKFKLVADTLQLVR